ncbi:hypothetical protein RSOLAG1IB_05196 [Rhizoctonia solani AG-1 IB]|uniref:Uncharacterized protein n=1 Tax=Thanatephorus cucumeris (strain AG1-IB / isolate 7/3/14) TaxID=1108050 RepID=A0A0B7FYZ9_THACB|nr:hypothetical protein RSOLAG1IB_05196 [Rhizoctonia solani AG-1 IB]
MLSNDNEADWLIFVSADCVEDVCIDVEDHLWHDPSQSGVILCVAGERGLDPTEIPPAKNRSYHHTLDLGLV